ncbi:MAG TPA: PmoA family protein [Candidatus Synoicihabitans sp.]|nr:PmoA family protein [Candidatus Synoicihabitans sp.]
MPPRLVTSFYVLALASVATTGSVARDYRVTVPAADIRRAGQVVRLPLPADVPRHVELRAADGSVLPVQRDDTGPARFVIADQPAGTTLTFTLVEATAPAADAVRATENGRQLDVTQRGQPAFSYWIQERPLPRENIDPAYSRSGFIHPVLTPAGVRVTESYAVGHVHHHGIWAPWTKTKFQGREPDFWNMGRKTGKVEAVSLDRHWSGPVHAGFVAQHRFIDLTAPSPVTALNETWEVTAYDLGPKASPARVFDVVTTQTCATPDPLILPEYHYGGMGYRGHEQWLGETKTTILTSEGVTDRVAAHGTRARWCHVGGEVDGKLAGTAILGHPDNFRAPQPMRIHPKEPFFCYAPSQLGDWQIAPGETYVARYRFVVMDGAPDAALLEAFWNGYAHPATATVTPF